MPAQTKMNPVVSEQVLKKIFDYAIEKGASDIHFKADIPPMVRIDSKLSAVPQISRFDPGESRRLIELTMTPEQVTLLNQKRELDFSFGYGEVRFRVNAYFEKGQLAAALRIIPKKVRTFRELGIPPIVERFTQQAQGLFIITGPTGHGKSTTLAAMVEHVNTTRSDHIITVENPIEYVFSNKQSIVSQREVGTDTFTFARALRSALRQDPNLILVGEMRDLETIDTALTAAETGHLLLTTLHTNSAAQTADRIIDVFPPYQQSQIRSQFAGVLLGIMSQRLIPKIGGGRVVATEILVASPAVRTMIREGKTHQLDNIIATSAAEGMISLDKVLAELVGKGEITIDDALIWAIDPKNLKTLIY